MSEKEIEDEISQQSQTFWSYEMNTYTWFVLLTQCQGDKKVILSLTGYIRNFKGKIFRKKKLLGKMMDAATAGRRGTVRTGLNNERTCFNSAMLSEEDLGSPAARGQRFVCSIYLFACCILKTYGNPVRHNIWI